MNRAGRSLEPRIVGEIREIPKIELHVHLEGSLTPQLSLHLARKNGIDIGAQTSDEVRDLYRFRDFQHFLTLYGELTALLAEPDDFRLAVHSYARQLADQGAIYAELTLTLGTHVHFKALEPEDVMRAAWQGAVDAEAETGVVIRFILDHVRSFSLERCLETVEWCDRFRRYGVVGLGLAGPELGWPASTYAPALIRAAELSIPFVPHAGEADGPDAIWDALQFNPTRVGHGLAASSDDQLLEALRTTDVLVEICVSSNVALNHARSHAQHPAREFREAGLALSINSDDPPMFNTDLLTEHLICYKHLDFGLDDLYEINRAALRHALAESHTLDRLRARL